MLEGFNSKKINTENGDNENIFSIRNEINEYEKGNISLSDLSEEALQIIQSGEDINNQAEKQKIEEYLKEEPIMENISPENKEKIKELSEETELLNEKYKELDEKFERLDSSGVSTAEIGKEMGEISNKIDELTIQINNLKNK